MLEQGRPSPADTPGFSDDASQQSLFSSIEVQDYSGFSSSLEWMFDIHDHGVGNASLDEPSAMGYMGVPFTNPPTPAPHTPPVISADTCASDPKTDKDGWIRGNLPTPELHDAPTPDDPWPMEHCAGPMQHVVLPPLGEAAGTHRTVNHFSTWDLSPAVHDALRQCIELPSEHSPWQSILVESFPSQQTVDHCIDMYFVHFHQARKSTTRLVNINLPF